MHGADQKPHNSGEGGFGDARQEVVRFVRTPEGRGVGAVYADGSGEVWSLKHNGRRLEGRGKWCASDTTEKVDRLVVLDGGLSYCFSCHINPQAACRYLLPDIRDASRPPHSAYPFSRHSDCSSLAVPLLPACIIYVLPPTVTHHPGCHQHPCHSHHTRSSIARPFTFSSSRNVPASPVPTDTHFAR